MISTFRRLFPVDLDECIEPGEGFGSFDAFFTRALRQGARPGPTNPETVACPCDGTISQVGDIESGRIIQAKGRTFTATELLIDRDWAEPFADGRFITLYLAPHDYHRVHMPVAGSLVGEARVPGKLFSVSSSTSAVVDRLYARNERMVAMFETEFGPVAVVMVAAMLVAGIETAWGERSHLRPGREITRRAFDPPIRLARGDEIGRFHWGSTVIVLLPPDAPAWLPALAADQPARLGQALTA